MVLDAHQESRHDRRQDMTGENNNIERQNLRWSRGLTVSGIVIAISNMAFAWAMMFASADGTSDLAAGRDALKSALHGQDSPRTTNNPQAGASAPSKLQDQDKAGLNGLMNKLIEGIQIESASENRRTTILLGFCFALISIGFALFVMGIEGAIGMRGEAGDFGTLLVKTSSPGIFCILLASILVAISLASRSDQAPANTPNSTKEDILRTEADTKERVIQAETFAKERLIEAETSSKERVIRAETDAKKEVLQAVDDSKERLLLSEPQVPARKVEPKH